MIAFIALLLFLVYADDIIAGALKYGALALMIGWPLVYSLSMVF